MPIMTDKDTYIKQLENTIVSLNSTVDNLQNQVDNLTEMLRLMQKARFGSTSEKTVYDTDSDQISIFNEAETLDKAKVEEPGFTTVKGYARIKKSLRKDKIIADLPVKEVICDLVDSDKFCEQCGTELKVIGKETVREEIEYIPAKLQIIRYVRLAYECPKCKHTDNPFIIKSLAPTSLMNHSLASPSSVANVMYQKYVNSMPLYRQEKEWEALGLILSRATMANWIIRCSEDYFDPLIKRLRDELLKRDIVHCDETPVQVLKEEGKRPQSKSYMWLYRSGKDGNPPIIIYDYKSSRSGDCAVEYLKDFKGYVHSDGYSGYNKLSGITRCGCWAHLRRKFVEALPPKKQSAKYVTASEIGRNYCDKLFHIEDTLKGLSPNERYLARLELERPLLDEFWNWLDGVNALSGSSLGKAVTYARNQKPYMENYLLDGRLEISNNAAENAIRPFTVGRKNWLFADTPKGANSSAMVYSLIETAKANGLNVRAYLQYLLTYMPGTNWRNNPSLLDDMMPWSDAAQSACKAK